MTLQIREATPEDFDAIWPIFAEIAKRGDTYGYEPDTPRETARRLWMTLPRATFVCESHNEILGTYYLKTNNDGPGAHVCNCGYMVSESARGMGLATAMCEHSQSVARELGYLAMQFNFVAASNAGAVRLWKKLGYGVVGTLPKAFRHPQEGFVDAYVMYKWLHGPAQ